MRVQFGLERLAKLAIAARYDARTFARLCGFSSRHVQRVFRQRYGRSPGNWLNEQRLIVAEAMLARGERVKDVAAGLGYRQMSHFCRQFKIFKQMRPAHFAAQARQKRRVAEG